MPNSLTGGALGLHFSCLDTSRSIDMKTTSEGGLKSLISRSPKNCSAWCNPPRRATPKARFISLRDAIRLLASSKESGTAPKENFLVCGGFVKPSCLNAFKWRGGFRFRAADIVVELSGRIVGT